MKFSIFTPTYNRCHTLERCYLSIINQNYSSVEWIVVDDGSTDNTFELISSLQKNCPITIKYIHQENSGKQTAYNKALNIAKGEYFITLDSDDALYENTLETSIHYLEKIENNNKIIGLRALAEKSTTKEADSVFLINENKIDNWFNEFSSRIFGERIDVLKTEEIKKFPYPTNKDIKFIPEIWFYCKISKKYDFYYINKYFRKFYDEDPNNRLSKSKIREHARGHVISRGTMLKDIPSKCFFKNPIAFSKTIIRFIQANIYCLIDKK